MKNTNEKKITTLKAFKVIMIIYSVVVLAVAVQTIYGWVTGMPDTNQALLASNAATYCALTLIYEDMKKKEAKKKEE